MSDCSDDSWDHVSAVSFSSFHDLATDATFYTLGGPAGSFAVAAGSGGTGGHRFAAASFPRSSSGVVGLEFPTASPQASPLADNVLSYGGPNRKSMRYPTGHTYRARCKCRYCKRSDDKVNVHRTETGGGRRGLKATRVAVSAFDVANPRLAGASEFSIAKHATAVDELLAGASSVTDQRPKQGRRGLLGRGLATVREVKLEVTGHVIQRASERAARRWRQRNGLYQVPAEPGSKPKLVYMPERGLHADIPPSVRKLRGRIAQPRHSRTAHGTRPRKAHVGADGYRSVFSIAAAHDNELKALKGTYLELDLGAATAARVTHISTQGRYPRTVSYPPSREKEARECGLAWPLDPEVRRDPNRMACVHPDHRPEFVTCYGLSCRRSGASQWIDLGVFQGNEDCVGESVHALDIPVSCRFLRFTPLAFVGRCSLRVGVYGTRGRRAEQGRRAAADTGGGDENAGEEEVEETTYVTYALSIPREGLSNIERAKSRSRSLNEGSNWDWYGSCRRKRSGKLRGIQDREIRRDAERSEEEEREAARLRVMRERAEDFAEDFCRGFPQF